MTSDRAPPRRVALFGATSDIAVAVARFYAEAGAKVVLVGRNATAMDAIAQDLKVRGAAAVTIQPADFRAIADLGVFARNAWAPLGGLDLALVAYGSLPDQAAMQDEPDAAADAMTLNFVSPATLIGALATQFEAQRSGTIAAISSVAGDRGRKSNYVYGASKGGLQRFLEGLRHRLHDTGVAVLDIRPGFVATKMTAHLPQGGHLWATPDKVAADIVKAVAARRAVLYTPWFWQIILGIVWTLPRSVFHRTNL